MFSDTPYRLQFAPQTPRADSRLPAHPQSVDETSAMNAERQHLTEPEVQHVAGEWQQCPTIRRSPVVAAVDQLKPFRCAFLNVGSRRNRSFAG